LDSVRLFPFRIPLCIINITHEFLPYKCNNGAVRGLAGLSMGLSGANVGIRWQYYKKNWIIAAIKPAAPTM